MTAVRVPILMYHRIGETHNDWERKYCVSPQRFTQHMHALARSGWCAVTIHDFFAWLDGEREIPEKSLLLTFDDGFLGVHEHAAPLLTALGWPATVFLVTQLIGKRDAWCETHNPSGATYPLMDASHIRDLRATGFTFYSHTRDHPDLQTLDDEQLHDQLAGSRADLEALLGEDIPYLAYPYGHYDDRVLNAAKAAGYRAAFSVQPGFNRQDVDRFRLRRIDVFGTDSAAVLRRKATFGSNDGSLADMTQYTAKRILHRLGVRNRWTS